MLDTFFQYFFLFGLAVGTFIRKWYSKGRRRDRITDDRTEGPVMWVLMSLWGVAQILPIFYVLTSWLDFANYHLPTWAGLAGAAIFVAGLWLLWRSHADLGRNWSPSLQIKEGHALETDGVYQHIRHPMYAAHLLWGIGQALLIQNWIAGWGGLVLFIPICLLRVPPEERMMLEKFGEEYRSYMERTGGIIPRLWR